MIRVGVAILIVAGALGAAIVLTRRGERQRHSGAGAPRWGRFPSSVSTVPPGGGLVVYVKPGCRSCSRVLAAVRASGRSHMVVESPGPEIAYLPTVLDVDVSGIVQAGWEGPLPAGALDPDPTPEPGPPL